MHFYELNIILDITNPNLVTFCFISKLLFHSFILKLINSLILTRYLSGTIKKKT